MEALCPRVRLLSLDHCDHGLALGVDHLEWCRYLAHLHSVDHTCHLGRQILHLETRRHTIGSTVRHQTFIIFGILIIREVGRSLLETELSGTDVVADGVEPVLGIGDLVGRHLRLEQDMAAVDLIATLVDEIWMMWKPNSDSTIFEIFLGSVRLKATLAKAGSRTPRPV